VCLAGDLIAHLNKMAHDAAVGPSSEQMHEFEPSYTTISVNRISGGTAANILAAMCEFDWDVRALPGESAIEIVEKFSRFAREHLAKSTRNERACAVQTVVRADVPGLVAERNGTAERLARSAQVEPGEPSPVPFGSEGGYFQRAGWSTILCGPGEIAQAHRPDEFVEQSQLAACASFLDRIVQMQCC
jgi:acetylornithine deacetylase